MKSIYFAGPLFSSAEITFNLALATQLENLGYKVFLPQRDGVESEKPPYNLMTKEERRVATFEMDRDAIFSSDIFLFVLDGRVPDEGACVELGLAYSHKLLANSNKQIIGIHTDIRAAFLGSKLNPMLKVPLDYLIESEPELFTLLESLSTNRTHES